MSMMVNVIGIGVNNDYNSTTNYNIIFKTIIINNSRNNNYDDDDDGRGD